MNHLETSTLHKVMKSPIGALFNNSLFEKIKNKNLPIEFKTAKIGAVARAEPNDINQFLRLLHINADDLDSETINKIKKGLDEFSKNWQEFEKIKQQYTDVLWNSEPTVNPDQLVTLEEKRREISQTCRKPTKSLGFLAKTDFVPVVDFDIPPPKETLAKWEGAINNPNEIFGPPQNKPQIQESAKIPGPSGVEYLIKFKSPSPLMNDMVYARIYEPTETDKTLPSFVFASGLGMMNDQIKYWPEEEYIGRYLSSHGFRVALIESPWHGRREKKACFSGEPYVATAPVGLFTLYAAQSMETGIVIDWLRSIGASAVGIGGVSLGGIVSEHFISRCGTYPHSMRPDMALLVATSNHIAEVVLNSEISASLELGKQVRDAGWDDRNLNRLKSLLDPNKEPGIPSENIFGIFGKNDTYIPYKYSVELMKEWNVSPNNITTWDSGHFGVLTRSIRKTDLQQILMKCMKKINRK
jgi:hypothetical protein